MYKNRIPISTDDIKEYFDHLTTYPSCKKEQYFKLKKSQDNEFIYKDVASKKQISQIIYLAKNKPYVLDYNRLFLLLSKFIYINDYYKLVRFISKRNRNDEEIYLQLQKFVHLLFKRPIKKSESKEIDYHKCSRDIVQVETMIDKIYSNIPAFRDIQNLKYIDIGCGDCKKSMAFGKLMKLDPKNIYGADLISWGAYDKDIRPDDLNFIELKENIPFPIENEQFDIVSCLMVLHHVENLDFFLKELNRILKPNGIIYITEHDAMTSIDKMLADIEHGMWEVVIRNNLNYFKDYKAIYYDWVEWNIIMKRYGFEYISSDYNYETIHANISATRYYYAIYQKN